MTSQDNDLWDGITEQLRSLTDIDLRATGGTARMNLAATKGDQGLLLAGSRPFAKGAYADPIIELGSLAGGLGADRLALSVTARAWSLDDPVVPVTEDADLRQQVLSITLVDGHGRTEPHRRELMIPFDVDGGDVTWHEPVEAGPGVGWLPEALTVFVRERHQVVLDDAEVRKQFVRCLRLGHESAGVRVTDDRSVRRRSGPRGGLIDASHDDEILGA